MLIVAIGIVAGLGPNPAPANQLAVARRIDIEVRIGDRDSLPGTLTLPRGAGPFPVVVLVHGSGAHDRDETIGANRPFRDIAHGLAERGIAVLRYEKRTQRYPRLLSDDQLTIDRETTDDALLAIARLRQTRMIDHRRIFVLGHSQGGMLAPRIAGRAPDVAGVILLAAPARPLLDLLAEQQRRVGLLDDGVINDAEQVALRRLVEGARAIRAGLEPPASRLPMGLSARYWRSVDAVDPVAEAKAIRQPMLLLQGGRDLQVVSADWLRWQRAFVDTPRVTFAYHDTLNHLGMHERGPGSLHSYQVPGKVSAELIDDIALWIELLRGVHGH
ncbi:alpha/beta hydrolase family protein [Lysobacter brunescens]|uniref:Alpha/beta hydrolase family protein n=1 Tax=Lysobacter brunescens TaxID=262323 RepID=A0ABW2YF99_9GAMM